MLLFDKNIDLLKYFSSKSDNKELSFHLTYIIKYQFYRVIEFITQSEV